ncbi:MAG TPA: efflux transporter outer membrane subunit [Casimicrobiaceae bacterium]|jgi:NodT family efflux transporter outer membrane factor (OMF) lipoprotein
MTMSIRANRFLVASIAAATLASCTVGPNYLRPAADTPAAYKEMPAAKPAEPADTVSRGSWWEIYGDAELNRLAEAVVPANQNLRVAEANYRQAQAAVRAARSGFYPTVGANVNVDRARAGGNTQTLYTLGLPVDWEIDLWGKIRRSVEQSESTALASAADIENTRLSLQAQLAQAYFALRTADRQKKLQDETVAAYQRSVDLTQNRYSAGVVARSDVVQAEAQLQQAQVQAVEIQLTRAQLEHAIAVLIGKPPSDFSLPPTDTLPAVPPIPAAIPSELLERRPDIAASERRVAAANAQIGVATAAFYPSLSLSGNLGFASTSFASWISLPKRAWSVGASLAQTLFDAGLRTAQRDEAIAAYDATVATYRQTVLNGFQQVEDNMAALRILQDEAQVQATALASARQAVELALNQYRAGLVNYINVVLLQAAALSAERNAVELDGRRLAASATLITALGGGWRTSDLPSPSQVAETPP